MSMIPTPQCPQIASACSIIKSAHGEVFLRMMRDLYFHGRLSSSDGITSVLTSAREIGLVSESNGTPRLTAVGYLVGNVAKEYCNYLDNNRVMPEPKPSVHLVHGKDVLDLGCSFGRWLWWFQRSAKSARGIEMQPEYIMLGQALSEREQLPAPEMICASVEAMDRYIPDDSLDLVFCRLVLNHVRILHTLSKAVRGLRQGGILWIQVESPRQPMKQLVRSNGRLRDNGFAAFALFNSALCMATGMQLSLSMAGRMHSVHKPAFPCLWWWKRAFSRVGLQFIEQTRAEASGFALSGRKKY